MCISLCSYRVFKIKYKRPEYWHQNDLAMVPPRVYTYKSKGPCWKRFGKFYIDVSLDLILKQAKFNIVSCMLCCVRNIFMYKEIGAGTFPGKVYIL